MSSQVVYTISTIAVDNFGLRALPQYVGNLPFDQLAPDKIAPKGSATALHYISNCKKATAPLAMAVTPA